MQIKNNDRLQRVQVGRDKEIPLDDNSNLWFLVLYKCGEWDAESNLKVFLQDIESGIIHQIFCVWHGKYRTNLFLMDKNFIIDYFNKHERTKDTTDNKRRRAN